MSDLHKQIELWFATHHDGESTDERELLNDALGEIKRLGDLYEKAAVSYGGMCRTLAESGERVQDLECKNNLLEAALRGVHGITFDDGYSVNVGALREAIYECGESPMEQRVQIDPVQYLRTRYVSVTDHNRVGDQLAECRRLLREAVLRDGLVDERWFREAGEAGGECDHEWETVDDSFDHEHGCELIVMDACSICGVERPHSTQRLDDDVI